MPNDERTRLLDEVHKLSVAHVIGIALAAVGLGLVLFWLGRIEERITILEKKAFFDNSQIQQSLSEIFHEIARLSGGREEK